ncbi:MAG: gamma-glutamyl-gamma-aminobutyrate hydrolase family protein [Candidatus Brocadiia bacterium]
MTKPLIGINASFAYNNKYVRVTRTYCQAVLQAGGAPVIIPPIAGNDPDLYIKKLNGIVFTGGADINPSVYGERPLEIKDKHGIAKIIIDEKFNSDMALMKSALRNKIPLLAICYGAQLLNVALKGRLFQDIEHQVKTTVKHLWARHQVYVCDTGLLHKITGKQMIKVYSSHHQAIKTPGAGLIINARAADTVIEGVELPRKIHPFCLGVQWHPEMTIKEPDHLKLFKALISACN